MSQEQTTQLSNGLTTRRDDFRTRSRSMESDGSTCSNSSSKMNRSQNEEAMEMIKDLNLACRNISKKVSVSTITFPTHEELRIDRSLEKESQACIRRQNRLFKKSNTVANIECAATNKRRFVLKCPAAKKEDQLDITEECLNYEDVEYLLLSSPDTINTKIRAVHKLVSLRAIKNNASTGDVDITASDFTNKIYPPFNFTTHSTTASKLAAFKQLRNFLMIAISDQKTVTFGEIFQIWNTRAAE